MLIKKNDTVVLISGTNKGKRGRILEVDKKKNRVFVEGVNLVSKSIKPNKENQKGGIIKKESSIHISNVMLIDSETDKRTRVKKVKEKGKKNITKVSVKTQKPIK